MDALLPGLAVLFMLFGLLFFGVWVAVALTAVSVLALT